MYSVLRPLIFRLDPERAHRFTIALLRLAGSQALGRALIHCKDDTFTLL